MNDKALKPSPSPIAFLLRNPKWVSSNDYHDILDAIMHWEFDPNEVVKGRTIGAWLIRQCNDASVPEHLLFPIVMALIDRGADYEQFYVTPANNYNYPAIKTVLHCLSCGKMNMEQARLAGDLMSKVSMRGKSTLAEDADELKSIFQKSSIKLEGLAPHIWLVAHGALNDENRSGWNASSKFPDSRESQIHHTAKLKNFLKDKKLGFSEVSPKERILVEAGILGVEKACNAFGAISSNDAARQLSNTREAVWGDYLAVPQASLLEIAEDPAISDLLKAKVAKSLLSSIGGLKRNNFPEEIWTLIPILTKMMGGEDLRKDGKLFSRALVALGMPSQTVIDSFEKTPHSLCALIAIARHCEHFKFGISEDAIAFLSMITPWVSSANFKEEDVKDILDAEKWAVGSKEEEFKSGLDALMLSIVSNPALIETRRSRRRL